MKSFQRSFNTIPQINRYLSYKKFFGSIPIILFFLSLHELFPPINTACILIAKVFQLQEPEDQEHFSCPKFKIEESH